MESNDQTKVWPVRLSSDSADRLVGTVVDERYELLGLIGRGGMGNVYLARHATLGRNLAMKVLRPDVSNDGDAIARFRQEAQAASAVGNQHIVDVVDFGSFADGSTYFVMEYLIGPTLAAATLHPAPLEIGRAAHIGRQLTVALGAAHRAGVVHRDLKPDNIQLIEHGDDMDFVKVLDFGIAKVGASASRLTQTGQVFGTPQYMAPEQCAGKEVDHRADIYSLGVILYKMLTGRLPFLADNPMGVMTQQLYETPIAPKALNGAVPDGLSSIVQKALAKDPHDRYPSMEAVRDDLDAVMDGLPIPHYTPPASRRPPPLSVPPMGSVPPPATQTSGLRWILAGVLIAALVVGGATAAALLLSADRTAVELVEVQSDPPGAEVFEGDVFLGNTPLELAKPPDAKTLSLSLRMPGYSNRTVQISRRSAQQARFMLEPSVSVTQGAPTHQGASLRIETEPSPAVVMDDERELGETPLVVDIPAEGTQTLRIRRVRYQDVPLELTPSTEPGTRHIKLERLHPRPGGGGDPKPDSDIFVPDGW